MKTTDNDKSKNFFSFAWRNFLAGTFHGLGFLFGTALFISVITFILNSVLGEVPFFSDFAQAIELWIESAIN